MVSGGWGDHEEKISSVEVMNTDSKQWYAGPPSPVAWRNMKTADMCYFVGGYTGRGSIQCVLSSNGLTGSTPVKYTNNLKGTWREIPGLQTTRSTPLSFGGSLLAVGGEDKGHNAVNAIHLYQPGIQGPRI